MDMMSLVTALVGAQTGMTQLAVAADMARMNQQDSSSVVKLVDAAQQNISSLANVAAGVGTNLDITA
ncbi:MAG: hypothetical protein WA776_02660 [Xanthobacteraceae bacterium]